MYSELAKDSDYAVAHAAGADVDEGAGPSRGRARVSASFEFYLSFCSQFYPVSVPLVQFSRHTEDRLSVRVGILLCGNNCGGLLCRVCPGLEVAGGVPTPAGISMPGEKSASP